MATAGWGDIIQASLSPERFQHSLRVAATAREIAKTWSADPDKSYLAGLVHDIARDVTPAELLKHAKGYGIVWDELERQYPILLHGPVGAAILGDKLGVTDQEILEAVRLHTTGDYPLGTIAKIVFLADYIEPGRDFPGVKTARRAARKGLDLAVAITVHGIIKHLTDKEKAIHYRAVSLYNHYVLAGVIGES